MYKMYVKKTQNGSNERKRRNERELMEVKWLFFIVSINFRDIPLAHSTKINRFLILCVTL